MTLRRYTRDTRRGAVFTRRWNLPNSAAETLRERFAFFNMHRSHILGYLVAGPDGSLEAGRRRYNWVWYRTLSDADGALERALTDASGHVHQYSLPAGAMPDAARDKLVRVAEETLPPQFATAVSAERSPFIQAIFDYAAPMMVTKRIALLGDAAFVVRPHTAMGVSKAAGDALALSYALAQADDLATALAAYDATRRAAGNEIVAYGRRLGGVIHLSFPLEGRLAYSADDRFWREAVIHLGYDFVPSRCPCYGNRAGA